MIGNLIAMAQTNLKRMLAYSTVSHVGFLLLGLAGGDERGLCGGAVLRHQPTRSWRRPRSAPSSRCRGRGFEADTIDDFKGLNARNPWQAGLVLCVMASLAGVPPFLGFWAKLVVLGAALDGGLVWLAILGVVCAVIGAFYYLRVIKVMYFDEPVGEQMPPRTRPRAAGGVRHQRAVAAGAGPGLESDHGVVQAGICRLSRKPCLPPWIKADKRGQRKLCGSVPNPAKASSSQATALRMV